MDMLPFITWVDPNAADQLLKLSQSGLTGPALASKISDLTNAIGHGAAIPTTEVMDPNRGTKRIYPSATVNRALGQDPIVTAPAASAEASNKAYTEGETRQSDYATRLLPLQNAYNLAKKIEQSGPGTVERNNLEKAFLAALPEQAAKMFPSLQEKVTDYDLFGKYLVQGKNELAGSLPTHSVAGLESAGDASPNMKMTIPAIRKLLAQNIGIIKAEAATHQESKAQGHEYGYQDARGKISQDLDVHAFIPGSREDREAYWNGLTKRQKEKLVKSYDLAKKHSQD
jgi:hypothetical protein